MRVIGSGIDEVRVLGSGIYKSPNITQRISMRLVMSKVVSKRIGT